MRPLFLFIIIILANINVSFGQSIFKNAITDTNPSLTNPYTNGQLIDDNISVSGIGRGPGLNGNTGINRYNARDWNTSSIDTNDYFEFTLIPNPGYKIDFKNLEYKAQVSLIAGPVNFAFRSSLDGFTTNISSPTITNNGLETTPTPIDLSGSKFQNIISSISFRFYAWGGSATTGTFSINDFTFNGTVSCNLSTPTIETIIQANCPNSTGTIHLKNLPATEPWDLFQNDVLIRSSGYGSTCIISNLTAGNYKYKISNGYCYSPSTNETSILSNTTSWNGSSWTNGNPNLNQHIIFNGNYISTVDIESCSCTVNSGNVVLQPNHSIKIANQLNINNGSLTFENNANLIQVNDNSVNSGNINYKRETTPISNLDYTYWSSPVLNFTIGAVSPNTLNGKWYSYNAIADNWKQESASTKMSPGIGYIIRGPESHKAPTTPSTYLATFVGTPNNGTINIPINGIKSSNLIGNPYPSAINADAFILENSAIIDGTIYFWTHNTAIQKSTNITNGTAGTGTYAYTSDDYASYNLTGGVAAIQTPTISGGLNTNIPNGKIAAGQGFFVTSKIPGTAIFNNSMRVDGSNNPLDNSQFFKYNTLTKSGKNIEKNRIWLNLTNTQGAFKQLLIGYLPNATNGIDTNYDGETFDSNPYLDFYSINEDKKLVIQGRAIPFDESDKINLGYRSAISTDYTIAINQIDGLFENKNIFLEDTFKNTITNLKEGHYTFHTEKGIFDNRFILRFTNKLLSKKTTLSLSNTIVVSVKNNTLKIQSLNENLKKVIISNLLGDQITKRENINQKEFSFQDLTFRSQILFIKIILQNGLEQIKKVIY
ncbi:hypothetical protein SLW70_02880 [Flavobacterium sp. NG2]|uniref:hypothetical protein n=1 Tax=Flavobacterium sp. NG2 TaxID=3097547 RepID=UPI002A804241|nr:hypothetical protein [Flavobacterium sp. NG2]WPR72099.1 hypothetical protein SLW70_02880 [Flavobacterium sp. NG2]